MSSNWTRYPISERDFRKGYTSVYAHVENHTSVTKLGDIRFLPLLFVVLAISARLVPGRLAGDALDARNSSLKYYWFCQYTFRQAFISIHIALSPESPSDGRCNSTGFSGYCPNPTFGERLFCNLEVLIMPSRVPDFLRLTDGSPNAGVSWVRPFEPPRP